MGCPGVWVDDSQKVLMIKGMRSLIQSNHLINRIGALSCIKQAQMGTVLAHGGFDLGLPA